MSSRNSIRTVLLFATGTLTLLIAILSLQGIYMEWRRLTQINELRNATSVSNHLFDSTEKLLVERDIALAILNASDAETIDILKPRLLEIRAEADAAAEATALSLARYNFPELNELQKEIALHLSDIQKIRQQIDAAVLRGSQSNPDLAKQWYDEITKLGQQTNNLWLGFNRHFTNIDPVVTQHLRYRHFLRVITDGATQERAIVVRMITANADPTPEEFVQLLKGRGIMQLSWDMSSVLADQSGLFPAIAPYYNDAKSHYDTLYDMIRDIFYMPGGYHGASYPISADTWIELSTEAADSLRELKIKSREAAQHYVDKLAQDAQWSIAIHMVLLLFAIVLSGYSFRVIIRRVIYPIKFVTAALTDAIQGNTPAFVPLAGKQLDEINKLTRVLNAFHENLEAVRQASAQVAHSESRYRALVEASAQVVWTWKQGVLDSNSPLAQWWEEVTGQPSSQIATFGWLELVHPDDRDRVKKIWEDAIANGKNFEMEYRLRARQGNYLHVAIRAVPLFAEDGTLHEFIGSLNDITARKQAEEQLLRYTKELERSNQELDDFAYIASHDLKEPLRGLFNHASFLLEDYAGKLDESGVRRLHRLAFLSQRMEHLVNDLLYFSRLGRTEMAIQEIDPNAIIKDIELMLESFLKERNARIRVPQPLPTFVCDRPRITEVFRNLITNAVKYNDKPERIVEIGYLENMETPQGTENSVFYVKDNGVGIAPEFHQEIFRIFRRLQAATEEKEEGTGVGLTFVKKIIERHKGRIWLESQPGQGTVFYFTTQRRST